MQHFAITEILIVVLFHNVTRYIDSLLMRIHVNITNLLNLTCTLVATSMVLGRFECSSRIINVEDIENHNDVT
jgi:hypothetical protein